MERQKGNKIKGKVKNRGNDRDEGTRRVLKHQVPIINSSAVLLTERESKVQPCYPIPAPWSLFRVSVSCLGQTFDSSFLLGIHLSHARCMHAHFIVQDMKSINDVFGDREEKDIHWLAMPRH